ncbi:MAG: AAA family ATPase [Stigonema ocellatum SAG 48.90 = DSM 106950]|nr:AAA family ATPase [Stigonema ocellatum SAG 48.90 = DSM 106950]
MIVEQALAFVDQKLPQHHLNYVQEIVFRASWQGQSYVECAKTYDYSPEYIKAVGYKLWQLLSLTFKEEVTKNNFQSIIRRHFFIGQPGLVNTHVKNGNEVIILKNNLIEASAEVADAQLNVKVVHNWGEAVDISVFYGRTEELVTLENWIEQERCRLIGIFGMGGIGKTALTAKLAKQLRGKFDYLWWRSLYDGPPLEELLADLISFLSNQQETEVELPKSIEGRISRLIDYLRSSRCLIVLDHVQSVLSYNDKTLTHCQRSQGYDILWQRVGEVDHQSTIILTSQEKPRKVELMEGERLPVRSLKLCGLKEAEGRAIFEDKGFFSGSENEWKLLMQYYAGNPLILKIVAAVVENLFGSCLGEFIEFSKQGTMIVDEIRDLLNCQFNRLSNLEQSVMYWLAIHQEPVSLQELRDNFLLPRDKQKLLDALMSLERRCLIDKAKPTLVERSLSKFTLQPIVTEFVTEHFIEQVCHEIVLEEMPLLMSHLLSKTQNKDSVRENRNRTILLSIAQQVLALDQNQQEQDIKCKLNRIFLRIREAFSPLPGYGHENIMKLSSKLNISLSEDDCCMFTIRQNDISGVNKFKSAQVYAVESGKSF